MIKLSNILEESTLRNINDSNAPLLGVNINKEFMPSIANTIGTNMKKYKIVRNNEFATNLMHVDRDKCVPIALFNNVEGLVSPAYNVFKIKKEFESLICPEYLMLCFKKESFDHISWYYSGESIRGNLPIKKFLDIELPIPSYDEQIRVVEEYRTIEKRIKLKEEINSNLTVFGYFC